MSLPLTSFYMSRGKPRSYCKACDAKYQRDPDALRRRHTKYQRKYLANLRANSPEYRAKKAEHDRAYRKTAEGRLTKLRAKARRRQRMGTHNLTAKQWGRVIDAFDNKCAYCMENTSLTVDHFIPISRGGSTTMGNIVCACASCNSSKQDKLPQDWCNAVQLERVLDILINL